MSVILFFNGNNGSNGKAGLCEKIFIYGLTAVCILGIVVCAGALIGGIFFGL